MLRSYNVSTKDVIIKTFLAYDPVNGSIRYRNCMFTVLVTGVMWFQYGVMIYCGWNMNSKMEEKIKNLSPNLRHHHKQLFKVLVFQISVPSIFLFTPSTFMLYLPYFQTDISFPAGIVICAFGLFPTTDSIIALCIVTEYRIAAKRIWKSMFNKSNSILPGADASVINSVKYIRESQIAVGNV